MNSLWAGGISHTVTQSHTHRRIRDKQGWSMNNYCVLDVVVMLLHTYPFHNGGNSNFLLMVRSNIQRSSFSPFLHVDCFYMWLLRQKQKDQHEVKNLIQCSQNNYFIKTSFTELKMKSQIFTVIAGKQCNLPSKILSLRP